MDGVDSRSFQFDFRENHYEYGKSLEIYNKPIEIEGKIFYQLKKAKDEYISAEAVIDKEPKVYFFVNELEGTNLYADEGLKNLIKKLSFGEKVVFLSKKNSGSYYVEYAENNFGYIPSYVLKQKGAEEYFKVATTSGLILREKPDQKSKQLDLLPLNYVGDVKIKDNHVLTIADKKGFWIFTEYNGKQGWIFSGFVYLSNYKNSLTQNDTLEERFYSLFEKLEELPSSSITKKQLEKDFKEVENPLIGDYSIRGNYYTGKDECGANGNSTTIINKSQKLEYEEFQAREEDQIFLKNRLYITSFITCYCCCVSSGTRFYFLLKNKIFAYTHYYSSYNFYWSVDNKCNLSFNKIKYSEKDSTLYLYALFPNCSIRPSSYEPTSSIVEFKEYTKELFIVVKILEDDVKITRFFDKSIPSEYVKSYEEAE